MTGWRGTRKEQRIERRRRRNEQALCMEPKNEFTMAYILPGAWNVGSWWCCFNLVNLLGNVGECDMKIDYDKLLNELIRETEQLIQKANYYAVEKAKKGEYEEGRKWAHRSMIYSFALRNLKDRENAKLILKMVKRKDKKNRTGEDENMKTYKVQIEFTMVAENKQEVESIAEDMVYSEGLYVDELDLNRIHVVEFGGE